MVLRTDPRKKTTKDVKVLLTAWSAADDISKLDLSSPNPIVQFSCLKWLARWSISLRLNSLNYDEWWTPLFHPRLQENKISKMNVKFWDMLLWDFGLDDPDLLSQNTIRACLSTRTEVWGIQWPSSRVGPPSHPPPASPMGIGRPHLLYSRGMMPAYFPLPEGHQTQFECIKSWPIYVPLRHLKGLQSPISGIFSRGPPGITWTRFKEFIALLDMFEKIDTCLVFKIILSEKFSWTSIKHLMNFSKS